MTENEVEQKLHHDTEEMEQALGNQFECELLQEQYSSDLQRYFELPPKSPAKAGLLATINALRARLQSLHCGVPVPH